MGDDKSIFSSKTWIDAFKEDAPSGQPDKRPVDQTKASGFMKGFSGESDKQATGVMQRRMDKLKGGY